MRQVAQHSGDGGECLALMPSKSAAMAGALSMCEGDALQAAMEGARKAHVEQLKKQERALEKALQPLEPEDSEEEAEAWAYNICSIYNMRIYHIISYHIISYHIISYCTVLYCTVLYCIVLYCIVLYCTVLYCIVLYCIVV